MKLTPETLQDMIDLIQDESVAYEAHSDEWFVYMDAADALADLSDLIVEEING